MAATAATTVLGTSAPDFRLPATDGKTYALNDIAGPKGTVIVFICNHCPYVKAVTDRLVRDAGALMAEGIGFAAICSNDAKSHPEDSFGNVKRFAAAHRFPFLYLHDAEQSVGRAYGAVCTPDFFGYDAGRKLQYRGRLDEGRTTPPPAHARRELVEPCAPSRWASPPPIKSHRSGAPSSGRRRSALPPTLMQSPSLSGKHALVTGATGGIGLAAAEALAALGAHVTIVGRNEIRARIAAARVTTAAAGGATVGTLIADLSSQAAVRKLAAEVLVRYPRLDILVNNAGAMHTTRQLSDDAIELTWAINHLAPFLLTTLLLDRLKASAPSRVITTASEAHQGADVPFDDLNAERSYAGFNRYKQTKLANVLFTAELARRRYWRDGPQLPSGIGGQRFQSQQRSLMDLAMTLLRPVSRSAEKGAETLVWLTESPDAARTNGGYYVDMEWRPPSPQGQDMAAARRLWEISEAQCAGPVHEPRS